MIRPIFTELALFLTPFAIYAVFLWFTRAGVLDASSWNLSTLGSLTLAALLLVIVSFVFFAQFSGSHSGSVYVPAHMEGGKLVPGQTQ